MERDCNRCVYSTRDGNCRKWSCEGTKTVNDIRAEAIEEFFNACEDRNSFYIPMTIIMDIAEQLKEQK